jgi:hypothetical protein
LDTRFQSLTPGQAPREDFSDYVAHLQLHMSLQARHLLPNLAQPQDSCQVMLQESQASVEKLVSRQKF